jgi:DNA repair photolyase
MNPPHALRRGTLADAFTCSLYACAPYRGCGHGCAYCDGRAEKYYVAGDFAQDIVVRADLPDRLRAELPRLREWGAVCLGSGVTDAYQPCEAEHRLTRRIAEVLAGMPGEGLRPLPAVILTKSARILEDLDLWTRINAQAAVLVLVSLATLDEAVRERYEPGASPVAERLEVLARFKAAGCLTGVLAMPFLPGISDGTDAMAALFARLEGLGVDFIQPGGLTLRPGRQKAHYLSVLAASRADLLPLYEEAFREERASGAPTREARKAWLERLGRVPRRAPWLLPHAGLRRLLDPPDELAVLLSHMGGLFHERGVDVRPLQAARDRYEAWLKERRMEFRRRRTLPPDWLVRGLAQAAEDGELAGTLGNPRLAAFVREVVLERALLDPATLKLQGGSRSIACE